MQAVNASAASVCSVLTPYGAGLHEGKLKICYLKFNFIELRVECMHTNVHICTSAVNNTVDNQTLTQRLQEAPALLSHVDLYS